MKAFVCESGAFIEKAGQLQPLGGNKSGFADSFKHLECRKHHGRP
jgi:hypothetical protein